LSSIPKFLNIKPKCEIYNRGKLIRKKIPKFKKRRVEGVLRFIHNDICGCLKIKSLARAYYFITFTNDKSRKTWVRFMKLEKLKT
jgi:hypothetical protein